MVWHPLPSLPVRPTGQEHIYASLAVERCLCVIYFLGCVIQQCSLVLVWVVEYVAPQRLLMPHLTVYIVSLDKANGQDREQSLFEMPYSFCRSEKMPSESPGLWRNSLCPAHK